VFIYIYIVYKHIHGFFYFTVLYIIWFYLDNDTRKSPSPNNTKYVDLLFLLFKFEFLKFSIFLSHRRFCVFRYVISISVCDSCTSHMWVIIHYSSLVVSHQSDREAEVAALKKQRDLLKKMLDQQKMVSSQRSR